MALEWARDGAGLYTARTPAGVRDTLHATVESLDEVGWDWHVWSAAGQGQQRYGLADTLEGAQAKAEQATAVLVQEFQQAAAQGS